RLHFPFLVFHSLPVWVSVSLKASFPAQPDSYLTTAPCGALFLLIQGVSLGIYIYFPRSCFFI
ncbi:hypothetical protein ACVRC9_004953, partial [Escherichia coli]